MTIFCVNDFPTIYLLTGGGPVSSTTTLVVLAYRTVFRNFQTGPGVAIAFIMTIVPVVVSVVLYRQIRKAQISNECILPSRGPAAPRSAQRRSADQRKSGPLVAVHLLSW